MTNHRDARVVAQKVLQLIVLVVAIAFLLSAGCGGHSYPLYPNAKAVSGDVVSGIYDACGATPNLRMGGSPDKKGLLEIHPHCYTATDPLESVKSWYEKNLADWDKEDFPANSNCRNGVSYSYPKGCVEKRKCEVHMDIIGKNRWETWIIVWTP
jgi:hypothetical protein